MQEPEMLQTMNQDLEEPTPQIPLVQPQVPSEILELELNYERTLDSLERKLSGHTKELEGKQRVWKRTNEPWMNQKGVSRIIAIIKGHVDVNTFLTQLQDSDINQIAKEIADEVTMILSNKSTDFGIDPTYLGIILSIIINNIYFALRRAQNALTLKQIHGITTRIESPLQLEREKMKERKGFLGRWF